jgi:hypothetical protein
LVAGLSVWGSVKRCLMVFSICGCTLSMGVNCFLRGQHRVLILCCTCIFFGVPLGVPVGLDG